MALKLLLAAMFSLFALSAQAACPGVLELQDANNIKAPAKYTDDGFGNCQVNTAIQDGASVTLGSKADATWVTGSGSVIAILKSIGSNPIPLGITGGWTPIFKGPLTATVVGIKSGQGQLGYAQCDNPNASFAYLQIFDLAAGSVSLGSTTPVQVIPVPASVSNGFVANVVGLQFNNAISVAATTAATTATGVTIGLNCSFGFH